MSPGTPLENRELRRRLAQAEATIAALLSEQVDAVVDARSMTPVLLSKAQAALAESEERLQNQSDTLRKSEERTNFVMGNAGMGLFEIDLVLEASTWSPTTAALYGLSPGQTPTDLDAFFALIHPDDRQRHSEAFASAVSSGTSFEVESRALWPDGSEHWIASRATVVRDDAGTPLRVLGAVTDIGAQKALEAQFQQSQKMEAVGQLAGGVAHDFNNLLTAVLLYSGFVMDTLGAEDPRRSDIEAVVAAAQRGTVLTRQLLVFSRKQVLQSGAVDLNGLIEGMRPMLSRLIGDDVQLVAVLAPDLGVVHADSGQLEQVLMNLVLNARDAMPTGGRVTITSARVELDKRGTPEPDMAPGSYLMFSVTDDGDGMTSETMQHMFEPFFTTKGEGKGTGLGLATVHGIVKQSGGFVSVVSEPTRGATFSVYLPRAERAVDAEATVVSEDSARHGTETVLLVEDEVGVRSVMRRILAQAGYTVLDAENPARAEPLFEQNTGRISLLVTDVVMPGLSGPGLYRRLARTSPALKVLYVSGYPDDTLLKKGELSPDAHFLRKPFTGDALRKRVRTILDGPPPAH